MSATWIGAVAGAAVAVAVSPYLAGLTLTAPDRDNTRWWRSTRTSATRRLLVAAVALGLGALDGAAAGWSAVLPAFIALALVTTPLVLTDFEHHRLPNRLVFAAYPLGGLLLLLAAAVRSDWSTLLRAIEGGAAVYAVLLVVVLIAPRSFGFGDVKLAGVLGGYLGWFSWAAVYYGIFAGFVLGCVLAIGLLAAGRATRKSAMAFGPMLILGAAVVCVARSALP